MTADAGCGLPLRNRAYPTDAAASLGRCVASIAALALLGACAATPAADAPHSVAARAPVAAAPATAPAPPRAVTLVNPGFESTTPRPSGDPEGWFTFQHAGEKSFAFTVDTVDPHTGAQSLRIDNVGPEPYGSIAQSVVVRAHGGKVARYTAWLRTRDVTGTGAVLTIMTLDKGAIVDHQFMVDRPVTGTTGWTRHTLTLPVARGVERLELGAMLQGKGSLWLDDAAIEFVDP